MSIEARVRHTGQALDIEMQLRGPLAAVLQVEARKRRRPPAELLADLIKAVLTDNLITAVLDDKP